MPDQPILKTIDLCTWFPVRRGIFSRVNDWVKAVNRVSLTIADGETLGLVGESGCGKTTLGRTIVGLERPTSGEIFFCGRRNAGLSGRDWREIRRNMQMVFQDPFSSLNPRMTAMDLITEGMVAHGLLNGARHDAAEILMREVGLDPGSMYRYPHEFSGGQRQRICVARALALDPRFIVCDEAVSALDVSVQAQVINLLMDLRDSRRLAYLFISHDLSVIKLISHRIAVMYLGQIVEQGSAEAVVEDPLHPYTQALISAVPIPRGERSARIVLGGEMPSPVNPPSGCPFHPRCPSCMNVCTRVMPREVPVNERAVRCHLYGSGEPTDRQDKTGRSAVITASGTGQEPSLATTTGEAGFLQAGVFK